MAILLQINVEVNFGSTGRIAEEIGQMALEKGWESYIAYGRKKRKSKSELISVGNKWHHLLHLIQTRLLDRHGLASKKSTRKFINQIEELNPSVVHLHNIHGYYLNYKLLFEYLQGSGIPIIWTFHDCWPFTGHCTHFEHIGCEKWMTSCHNCPQLNVYPSSLGIDRSGKNQKLKKQIFTELQNLTIVSVSEWLNNTIKKSFLANHQLKVIPNGIDTSTFRPRPSSDLIEKFKLKNKFIILGVASVWSINKGLEDFIKLSKSLAEDELIVLIGLTQKQISKLPENILGIKRTDSVDELVKWYSTADVYVNTSFEESFGITNAEAMACGTPVVVYDATASPEMVTPEVGYINEKNDVLALYNSISKIKEQGKVHFTLNCRERAIRLYDKNKNFMKYLELYEQVIFPTS